MSTQLLTKTARFGAIEYRPEDVLNFAGGLLGFPACDRFVLIEHKEGSPFRWLQSLDEPSVAFLVVDPGHFVEDFAPEMPDCVANALGLECETPRLVYTIVTIPPGKPRAMTINLAGPIVVNAENRSARQVVLEDVRYPIRFPVFQERQEQAA